MKKLAVGFWGVVFVLVLMLGLANAAEKFGYVDLSRLFSEYGKTKDYDKTLSEKEKAYTSERDKKVNEIKQLQDKMNLLSDKEKEVKKADLEAKVKALQQFDQQEQTGLRKDQDEKMKEIIKDIEATVKQHAEKEGYTMVFNSDRVLLYGAKDMDITDSILAILNKGYKK